MKKLICLILALFITMSLAACGAQPSQTTQPDTTAGTEGTSAGTRTITDRRGRQVEIPAQVDTIVCLGSGAPRIAAYLQVTDMMVGAEDFDKADVTVRRDYSWVYRDTLKDLPSVGSGGGSGENNAYAEEIIKLQPDVILAGYTAESADELQNLTGIPVVSVSYSSINFVDESFYEAVRIFAQVVGAEARAEELLSFIDECKADLTKRTADAGESSSCYTGAVTFSGRHGFCGTYANFGPFMAVNAKNVADEISDVNYFETDFEQVLVWDPDIIFLDPGNMDMVSEEYASNPQYFQSLRAVQEENIYTMPSFNSASTNITYCLMNGYWTGMVLYPEAFSDLDMEAVAEKILTFMLGENYYADMVDQGLYYGKLTLGE